MLIYGCLFFSSLEGSKIRTIKIAEALDELFPLQTAHCEVIKLIGMYKSKFCDGIYFSALLKLKYCCAVKLAV
jgi:hypothetical protein